MTQLKALVNFPTRGDSILDQIFSNMDCYEVPQLLPPLGRSDHSVILWKPVLKSKRNVLTVKVRKFSKSRMANFHKTIAEIDWVGLSNVSMNLDICMRTSQECIMHH